MRLPRAKAKGKRCYHRKKTNKADADGLERELEASVELEEAWRLLCRDAEGSSPFPDNPLFPPIDGVACREMLLPLLRMMLGQVVQKWMNATTEEALKRLGMARGGAEKAKLSLRGASRPLSPRVVGKARCPWRRPQHKGGGGVAAEGAAAVPPPL